MPVSHAPFSSATTTLRLAFAGSPAPAGTDLVWIPAPWLGGEPTECLFPDAIEISPVENVRLFQAGDFLIGCAREAVDPGDLASGAEALYRRVLGACGGRHLYRVWNYVPAINAQGPAGENYRLFCVGRARAFEQLHGAGFEARLPAASAVGSTGRHLDVLFVAGASEPRHIENPEQIPAYRYPIEHGPRSPSFARATMVRTARHRLAFVSGTAAIKGHLTVAPGELDAQIDCTLDNLRLISRVMQLGDDLQAGPGGRRHFKVYLRFPRDLDRARTRLERDLVLPGDVVTYLHAEICRSALNIEIEATLLK